MSQDQRMARDGREPTKHGSAGAQRWADYLDWTREELIGGVLGLDEAQRRTSRVPSGWTPIEMLSHVLHMEQRWFVWGFLGEDVAAPWGDWNVEEPWRSDEEDDVRDRARWTVPPDVTAQALVDQLREVGERTRWVLHSFPLDATASSGGRFAEDPPSLEWICFHVLAEYARHAGHLDLAVEISG